MIAALLASASVPVSNGEGWEMNGYFGAMVFIVSVHHVLTIDIKRGGAMWSDVERFDSGQVPRIEALDPDHHGLVVELDELEELLEVLADEFA